MPDPTGSEQRVLDGRYRLGETLGRGGMADVYRADDLLLGREVAVKLVRAGADGVATDERARGEVGVLAALNHPSLVTLYDAHLDADPAYLVMELVEGPTLSARILDSPLSPAAAAGMAAELGEALHVAHAAGIVHRDVKPSNVLLAPSHLPDREFRAKLADFGIAYLVDAARVTNPGEVIGTAAYLAPEQVRGVDPAPPADVYALGLILLEALTGRRAFPEAAGVATALARLDHAPEIPDTVDADLQLLIREMTRIDPEDRPTALEVAVRTRGWGPASGPATAVLPAPVAPPAPLTTRAAATEAIPVESAAPTSATAILAATQAPATPAAASATTPGDGDSPQTRVMDAAGADSSQTDERPRRRRGVWIAAAAAAAIVAGSAGVLAVTAGGDDPGRTDDPAPVTEPSPRASDEAPDPGDPASETEDADLVSETDDTTDQPAREETDDADPQQDPAQPDDGATPPADDGAEVPSEGADDADPVTPEEPAEPSPAPDPVESVAPEAPSTPAAPAPSPAPTG